MVTTKQRLQWNYWELMFPHLFLNGKARTINNCQIDFKSAQKIFLNQRNVVLP